MTKCKCVCVYIYIVLNTKIKQIAVHSRSALSVKDICNTNLDLKMRDPYKPATFCCLKIQSR